MRTLLVVLLGVIIVIGACAPKEETAADKPKDMVSLENDIMPIIGGKCGSCHRRETVYKQAVANGVFYETEEDILGFVGKDIIPGKPDESKLYGVLNQTYPVGEKQIFMPHAGSGIEAWTKEELNLFANWVKQGANDN